MAYYTPNNNAGIPTLDLTEFGLTQPQENMQVAEAFNYNTLPQATQSFNPRSTMTTGSVVDRFMNENPNATKGDFVNALQSGSLGVGGNQLFDKNVDDLFEGVNLDARGFGFGNVSPTFKGTTDGSFRGNIDIDKGALSDDALQSLPKGFFQNQSSLVGPAGYQMTAMAMDPNRMTDAGYPGFFSQGDAVSGTNVQGMDLEMDPGAFMNPNIQPSQNMFQRFGGAMQDGIGSMRDFAVDKGMSAKNLLGSGAAYAMGLPGVVGSGAMSLLDAFRGNPEQRARNEYNKQFSTGDTYGYGMGSASGANKDAFGYNTVSAFGNYEQHMIDTVEKLEDLLEKTNRKGFKPGTPNFNKLKTYNKSLNKIQQDNKTKKEEAAATAAAAAAAAYANERKVLDNYFGGSGTGPSGNRYDGAPTAEAYAAEPTAYSGPFKDGGLATMFVRRG